MHTLRLGVALVVCSVAAFALAASAPGVARQLPPDSLGLNCGPRAPVDPATCWATGAWLARVSFPVGAAPKSMARVVAAYARRGIKLQPIANFEGRLPTAAETQNLRAWALNFGPRGTFWQSRKHADFAFTAIELGNETSYGWQYGDTYADESYAERARTYALRARQAWRSLRGTGVGLLVQGDDGGSRSTVWIDQLFATAPELWKRVAGWTIHPYGPSGYTKIDDLLRQLVSRGVSAPRVFVTEWGLASDDGRPLTDNYGYPVDMTYDAAASTLRDTLSFWRGRYGKWLAQVLLYQSHDQTPPARSTDRERYFGVLQHSGAPKGAYTTEVRAQLVRAWEQAGDPSSRPSR